jgi:hypothetical protein
MFVFYKRRVNPRLNYFIYNSFCRPCLLTAHCILVQSYLVRCLLNTGWRAKAVLMIINCLLSISVYRVFFPPFLCIYVCP